MEEITFREAQLLVLGTMPEGKKRVELNSEQIFKIGDCVEVVEIRLDEPLIVLRMAEGPESYSHIDNFSDTIVNMCVEILRDIARGRDWENHKNELWKIQSRRNVK